MSKYWEQFDRQELDDMMGVEKFIDDDNFMLDADEVELDEEVYEGNDDICSNRDFL